MKAENFNITLIAIIIAICFTNSHTADDGCYKIPLIDGFDPNLMMGTWYLQEVGDDNEAHKNCLQHILTSDQKKSGGTVTFVRNFISGNKQNETFQAFQQQNTSHYMVQWKGGLKKAWLVATDYKSWSIYYVCIPEENDKGIFFISTRSNKPNKAILDKAHNALAEIGLPISKLHIQVLNRTSCQN